MQLPIKVLAAGCIAAAILSSAAIAQSSQPAPSFVDKIIRTTASCLCCSLPDTPTYECRVRNGAVVASGTHVNTNTTAQVGFQIGVDPDGIANIVKMGSGVTGDISAVITNTSSFTLEVSVPEPLELDPICRQGTIRFKKGVVRLVGVSAHLQATVTLKGGVSGQYRYGFVNASGNFSLDQTIIVNKDITLVGDELPREFHAAGKTPEQLNAQIRAYMNLVVAPPIKAEMEEQAKNAIASAGIKIQREMIAAPFTKILGALKSLGSIIDSIPWAGEEAPPLY